MGRLGGRGSASSKAAGAKAVVSSVDGSNGGSRRRSVGYGDSDVAKLKEAIQSLCRSTNPLGESNVAREEALARTRSKGWGVQGTHESRARGSFFGSSRAGPRRLSNEAIAALSRLRRI